MIATSKYSPSRFSAQLPRLMSGRSMSHERSALRQRWRDEDDDLSVGTSRGGSSEPSPHPRHLTVKLEGESSKPAASVATTVSPGESSWSVTEKLDQSPKRDNDQTAGQLAVPTQMQQSGSGMQGANSANASSSKNVRKTKTQPHLHSACSNCKKAHLSCSANRPCNRCVASGKSSTCVDVQHKKRGRPPVPEAEKSKHRRRARVEARVSSSAGSSRDFNKHPRIRPNVSTANEKAATTSPLLEVQNAYGPAVPFQGPHQSLSFATYRNPHHDRTGSSTGAGHHADHARSASYGSSSSMRPSPSTLSPLEPKAFFSEGSPTGYGPRHQYTPHSPYYRLPPISASLPGNPPPTPAQSQSEPGSYFDPQYRRPDSYSSHERHHSHDAIPEHTSTPYIPPLRPLSETMRSRSPVRSVQLPSLSDRSDFLAPLASSSRRVPSGMSHTLLPIDVANLDLSAESRGRKRTFNDLNEDQRKLRQLDPSQILHRKSTGCRY